MKSLKRTVKSLVRGLGYELVPVRRGKQFMFRRFMATQDITQVIDVGANTGQFSLELREMGYTGDIYCFEPLSSAYAELMANTASDTRMHLMDRCAVGAESGKVTINISGNSVSSSILDMETAHSNAAKGSIYVATEEVDIVTFDSVRNAFAAPDGKRLLKIDTQGFEAQVLDGAKLLLPECHAVYLELSLTPLYTGQALWNEVSDLLLSAGLELWNLNPNFYAEDQGRILQMDGLFVRPA